MPGCTALYVVYESDLRLTFFFRCCSLASSENLEDDEAEDWERYDLFQIWHGSHFFIYLFFSSTNLP